MPLVRLPDTPLAPNHGRVVIDTTNGPMRVAAKYDPSFTPPGGVVEKGQSGELCVTPCIVDLPVGKYRLFFSALANSESALGDTDDLVVSEGVMVYRRAPGRYQTPSPIDQLGPAALMVAGGIALALGAFAVSGPNKSAGTGSALLVGGVAGIAGGGVWAYETSRAIQQDGASTVWHLATQP